MRTRHLEFLILGCLFAALPACGESAEPVPDAGPDTSIPSCASGEAGTRTYPIRRLGIPLRGSPDATAPGFGFNVDGLTSYETDLAGCYTADLPRGLDNAFCAMVDETYAAFSDPAMFAIDIPARLQAAVDAEDIDLELVLGDWNETRDDSCVSVEIRGTTNGVAITPMVAEAPLVDGFVMLATFRGPLTFTPKFAVKQGGGAGACTSDCVFVGLPIVMQDVRARLRFSSDMTTLDTTSAPVGNDASMIGGYVRFEGTDPGALATSFTTLVDAIEPLSTAGLLNVVRDFTDLDSTPVLSACTAVGEGTSADTLSAAFLISSVAPD